MSDWETAENAYRYASTFIKAPGPLLSGWALVEALNDYEARHGLELWQTQPDVPKDMTDEAFERYLRDGVTG